MQHMPHHTQTLVNAAHTLGGIVDDLIQKDLDSGELDAVANLSAVITANLRANQVFRTSYLLASLPSGYLATKMFDTNTDPSNMKTIGTMVVGAVLSGGVSALIMALTRSEEKGAVKTTAALISDAEAAIKFLQNAGKLTTDESSEALKSLRASLKSYDIISLVSNAILSLESIATAYHGYRRNNDSIGYALAWGLTNRVLQVGLGVAIGQGYAKPLPK
jgi:hypothetical protein